MITGSAQLLHYNKVSNLFNEYELTVTPSDKVGK